LTPHDVEREGISPDTGRRAVEARAAGRRLKLVAGADRDRHGVRARVALEELGGDDLLAGIEGSRTRSSFARTCSRRLRSFSGAAA